MQIPPPGMIRNPGTHFYQWIALSEWIRVGATCADPKLINLLKIQTIRIISTLLGSQDFSATPSLSSAILPRVPEISSTQDSLFRYAAQIDNFCRPGDNCRGWQVLGGYSWSPLFSGSPLPSAAGLGPIAWYVPKWKIISKEFP